MMDARMPSSNVKCQRAAAYISDSCSNNAGSPATHCPGHSFSPGVSMCALSAGRRKAHITDSPNLERAHQLGQQAICPCNHKPVNGPIVGAQSEPCASVIKNCTHFKNVE